MQENVRMKSETECHSELSILEFLGNERYRPAHITSPHPPRVDLRDNDFANHRIERGGTTAWAEEISTIEELARDGPYKQPSQSLLTVRLRLQGSCQAWVYQAVHALQLH